MRIDVETIERATVDGVVPASVEELPGWLLPFDPGTVGRARSAVPLHHLWHDPKVIPQIIERYRAHELRPQFRLPDTSSVARLHVALGQLDFEHTRSSYVQVIEAAPLTHNAFSSDVEIADTATPEWTSTFCAVQFNAKDQPARAAALARSPNTRYVSVHDQGKTVSVGAITFARGLGCVHGMRTLAEHRGHRHAQRVLDACARAASSQNIEHLFLQVETENAAARAAYKRAGFTTLWRYSYWQRPADTKR